MTDKNMISTYRQQMMFISQQKQQLQIQVNVLENTIKELESTKETKVYKGTGNIFILSDKEDVLKQTKDNIETVKLRLKTIEKQESEIVKKLNELSKDNSKDTKQKDDSNPEGIA